MWIVSLLSVLLVLFWAGFSIILSDPAEFHFDGSSLWILSLRWCTPTSGPGTRGVKYKYVSQMDWNVKQMDWRATEKPKAFSTNDLRRRVPLFLWFVESIVVRGSPFDAFWDMILLISALFVGFSTTRLWLFVLFSSRPIRFWAWTDILRIWCQKRSENFLWAKHSRK